jgi:hypothetical protein
MKKISIIGFTVMLLSLYIHSESIIKFKEKKVDFGVVEEGKTKQVQFEFENIGDSLLLIKKISSSCGCTVAKLQKREYKPGEKGTIVARFHSRGYFGPVAKTVTVKTNQKKNSRIRLKFFGEVISERYSRLRVTPKKVDFDKAMIGKKYLKIFKMENSGTINLKILEITHPPEIITEFSQYTLKPGGKADLMIKFKPLRIGKHTSFIRIATDSHNRFTTIKISADVEE